MIKSRETSKLVLELLEKTVSMFFKAISISHLFPLQIACKLLLLRVWTHIESLVTQNFDHHCIFSTVTLSGVDSRLISISFEKIYFCLRVVKILSNCLRDNTPGVHQPKYIVTIFWELLHVESVISLHKYLTYFSIKNSCEIHTEAKRQ